MQYDEFCETEESRRDLYEVGQWEDAVGANVDCRHNAKQMTWSLALLPRDLQAGLQELSCKAKPCEQS